MAGGPGQAVSAPSGEGGLVGNPAPDFSVAARRGRARRALAEAAAREGRARRFLGHRSARRPCKSSFPKLQALNAKYAGSGLQIVGISEDEAEDKAKIPTFASTYTAPSSPASAVGRGPLDLAAVPKPETMPSSFLIDRKGIVRFAHVGYRAGDEVQIEKEIQDLLAR